MDIFTEQGKVTDEVTLNFDDGKMLFASKQLLTLTSPVFEAMFNNDCTERKEMKVDLSGKSFDDFLEFLMCMHPRIAKSIDGSNVLRVAPIAEEYQVVSVIKSCRAYMKKWIKGNLKEAQTFNTNWYYYVSTVRTALAVLTEAARLGYDDICMYVSSVLGKYPSGIYVGYKKDKLKSEQWAWNNNKESVIICREMFSRLPAEWKYQTLLNRFDGIEENKFKC